MDTSGDVTLDLATAGDAGLLSNLLQLYIHDLSAAFPDVEIGADGRFGYQHLPLYWSEPARRFPFLVKSDGRVAGFALARRGSPASDDPEVFDVAEFFILRRYRRAGVGRHAAALLWRRLAGPWTVRVSERNGGALPFWAEVIGTFTRGRARETRQTHGAHLWHVYAFDSRDQID